MKTRKILGNLLAGLGGVLFFVGLFALLLPKSQNQQLQLLLSSFRTPTDNVFLQWMNNGMNGAMEHCTSVIVIGLVLTVLGLLLIFSVRTTTTAAKQAQPRRQAVAPVPAAMPVPANPFARNQPAATESNPFARYIAPDTLPKSTEVRIPAAAATRTEETLPEAFAPLADSEPTPAKEQPEEVLYGLIDDEDDLEYDLSVDGYYPLQLDEDEDDEDEYEEQPVAEALAAEEEPTPCELLEEEPVPFTEAEAQPEPVEEDETFFAPAESAGPADAFLSEAPAVEEEPTQELPSTPEAPEAPEAAEEAVPEAAPESAPEAVAESAAPEQTPDTPAQPVTAGAAASAGLRPAIRSTFRKSTVDSSTGSQPVSRIKSTMGHKR